MTGWALVAAGCAGAATLPTRIAPVRRVTLVTRRPAAADRSASALVGAVLAVVLALAATSSILLVVVVAVGVVAATCVRRARLTRLRQARGAACVEFVFALAAELRAGRPPAHAFVAAGGCVALLSAEVERAADVLAAGSATAAVARLAEVPGCEALRGVAAAWSVTESVGGPVADVLDRLGDSLDATADIERTMRAALAGPRSTVGLLAFLPVLGLALAQSVGAHPLRLLLHEPLGWGLLVAAAVLECAGLVWTRTIVSRALR